MDKQDGTSDGVVYLEQQQDLRKKTLASEQLPVPQPTCIAKVKCGNRTFPRAKCAGIRKLQVSFVTLWSHQSVQKLRIQVNLRAQLGQPLSTRCSYRSTMYEHLGNNRTNRHIHHAVYQFANKIRAFPWVCQFLSIIASGEHLLGKPVSQRISSVTVISPRTLDH